MKKVFAAIILTMGIASLANAQATRTWVSGVGDDVNPCSRTAPCKTFAGAISKTASPGIINCLDPGGFGAVTITKSIMIDCTGTLGSTLHSGVQGIIVNTGLTTDKVILRNFDISGAGTTLGTNGVNIIQAGSVQLQGMYIETDSGQGVQTTNSSNQISVFVDGCHISNVGGTGVMTNSSGTGSTLLTVSNSQINNNNRGVDVEGSNSNSAQVSYTVLSHNASDGFKVGPAGSGGALDSDNISFNGNGINSAAGGTIRISRCLIHANFTNGVTGAGTTCFGTNVVDGNVGSNTCTTNNAAMH